jgi:putative molybdopterin biosynthesis protein
VADLARKHLRLATRQPEAGSHRLLLYLLKRNGIAPDSLAWLPRAVHAETELATVIRQGSADVGLGIEAAARGSGLMFIPLAVERLDLVAFRRDVFEPALQTLLAWTRSSEFAAYARTLGGYDVANTGRVVFNS